MSQISGKIIFPDVVHEIFRPGPQNDVLVFPPPRPAVLVGAATVVMASPIIQIPGPSAPPPAPVPPVVVPPVVPCPAAVTLPPAAVGLLQTALQRYLNSPPQIS